MRRAVRPPLDASPVPVDYDAVATATLLRPEGGKSRLGDRRQIRKSERTNKSRLG